MSFCTATVISGKRKGQTCGKRAACHSNEGTFCRAHARCNESNSLVAGVAAPINMLCKFGVSGVNLARIDEFINDIEESDRIGAQLISRLRGRFHVTLGNPISSTQRQWASVYDIPPERVLNHRAVAIQIRDCIRFMLQNRDLYGIQSNIDLADIILIEIRYVFESGTYHANMCLEDD